MTWTDWHKKWMKCKEENNCKKKWWLMYWYQPGRKSLAASQKVLIWLSPVKHFYHSFTWRDRKHTSQISEWSNNREGKFTTADDCTEIQIIQMCWWRLQWCQNVFHRNLPKQGSTHQFKVGKDFCFCHSEVRCIIPPPPLRNNSKIRSKTEISKPHLW